MRKSPTASSMLREFFDHERRRLAPQKSSAACASIDGAPPVTGGERSEPRSRFPDRLPTRSRYWYLCPSFSCLAARFARSALVPPHARNYSAIRQETVEQRECHPSASGVPMALRRAECHECHDPFRGGTWHDGLALTAPKCRIATRTRSLLPCRRFGRSEARNTKPRPVPLQVTRAGGKRWSASRSRSTVRSIDASRRSTSAECLPATACRLRTTRGLLRRANDSGAAARTPATRLTCLRSVRSGRSMWTDAPTDGAVTRGHAGCRWRRPALVRERQASTGFAEATIGSCTSAKACSPRALPRIERMRVQRQVLRVERLPPLSRCRAHGSRTRTGPSISAWSWRTI